MSGEEVSETVIHLHGRRPELFIEHTGSVALVRVKRAWWYHWRLWQSPGGMGASVKLMAMHVSSNCVRIRYKFGLEADA